MTSKRPDTKTRLVLLFGGESAEHDVSCVSARHVMAAIDPATMTVDPIGITRDGRWLRATDATRALQAGADSLPEALAVSGPDVDPLPALLPAASERVVVFPLLHGPHGEDGTVQGLLELAGVPYVGSGVLASALAMDKAKAKEMAAFHGIPQARWRSGHADSVSGELDIIAGELGFPIFVKPSNMGSSIGVSKATDFPSLADAVDLARQYDEWLVFEEAVEGREIEIAVLGNLAPVASVAGEIIPGSDFYDFEDKYLDGAADLIIPADLTPEQAAGISETALRAYGAMRCEGMARVDFFLEDPGRGWLLNEINTIPGFTPISMYSKLWEASGVTYPELVRQLVELAFERHDRHRSRTSTDRRASLHRRQ